MYKIYEFVNAFLDPTKENLRFKVLKNHIAGLDQEVSPDARGALSTMLLNTIRAELIKELTKDQLFDVGECLQKSDPGEQVICILNKLLPNSSIGQFRKLIADLETKRVEAFDMCPGGPIKAQATDLVVEAAYDADRIHVFGVIPRNIPLNQGTPVTIRGNGYEYDKMKGLPLVEFRLEADMTHTKRYQATSISCDPDLNEYLLVTDVTLDQPGNWRAYATNDQSGVAGWSTNCAAANLAFVE